MAALYSTCENPEPPTWTWRYNRDKHLTRFEPWMTRVDQWPPRYRHMGVPYNFDFRMDNRQGAPSQQLKLTYAKELGLSRATGYGNAGLGNPPGPAPPQLRMYNKDVGGGYVGELYRQNELYGISGGMSSWDNTYMTPNVESQVNNPPLTPAGYLKQTLSQELEYPGTFPVCNVAPDSGSQCTRSCHTKGDDVPRSPLDIWTQRHNRNVRQATLERASASCGTQSARPRASLDSGAPRSTAQYASLGCNNNNNNNSLNSSNNVFGNNTARCMSDTLSDHYLPSIFVRPATSALVAHHQGNGASRDNFPLANF